MRVAGLGCRRGASVAAVLAILEVAARACGPVEALATPAFKGGEAGLREAAAILGLPLVLVSDEALAGVQASCGSGSEVVRRHVGHGSVAEAAALAASGGRLVLARIVLGGVTCAVAVGAVAVGAGAEGAVAVGAGAQA